jgi:hypothetical protein
VTPIVGGAWGSIRAFVPGVEASVSAGRFDFYVEGEYVRDRDLNSSYLYAWSELGFKPVEWLRAGLVAQRTRAYGGERDIQRGPFAQLTWRNFTLGGFLVQPGRVGPGVRALARRGPSRHARDARPLGFQPGPPSCPPRCSRIRSRIAAAMASVSAAPRCSTDLVAHDEAQHHRVAQLLERERVVAAADRRVVVQHPVDDAGIEQLHLADGRLARHLGHQIVHLAAPELGPEFTHAAFPPVCSIAWGRGPDNADRAHRDEFRQRVFSCTIRPKESDHEYPCQGQAGRPRRRPSRP